MAEQLHVWPGPRRREDDQVVLPAILEWSGGERESLWYRVPESDIDAVTTLLDPFVVALVMFAMRRGAAVSFHGPVSASLLASLQEFQEIWQFWRPAEYRAVALSADEEVGAAATPDAGGAIVSFSGGVDASYSVYRHVNGLAGRRNLEIRAGLMVEGFDIPLGDPNFSVAAAGARRMLDSLGIPLITAATNWREIESRHRLDWTQSFGSALIACLSLFSRRFSTGMLGSGDRYYDVRPHGSTPLTDPLLGSESFEIRHDGAAASRVEKVALVAQWPEALNNLRVCWEGLDKGRNCGQCEKCIRTILNFRVNGLELPPCFDRDVSLDQIRSVPIWFDTQREEFQSIVDYAEAAGSANEPWVRALERRIRAHRVNPDDLPFWTRINRRLAVGTRLRGWFTSASTRR